MLQSCFANMQDSSYMTSTMCVVQKFHVVWKQVEADAEYQEAKAKHKLLEQAQQKAS